MCSLPSHQKKKSNEDNELSLNIEVMIREIKELEGEIKELEEKNAEDERKSLDKIEEMKRQLELKKNTHKTGKKMGLVKDIKRNKKHAERPAHLHFICPYDNFMRTKKKSIFTHIYNGNGGCKRFNMLKNGKELIEEKEKIIEDIKNFNPDIERSKTNYSNYLIKTEVENKADIPRRLLKMEGRQKNNN